MRNFLNIGTLAIAVGSLCFSAVAHSFEFSLETDLIGPVLRLAGRTGVEQHWISPGILLNDRFVVRAEFFLSDGNNFSSGSVQSGGGRQVGEQNVKTSMRGASFGYCLSGCTSSSFRAIAGIGRAERRFEDTMLGPQSSTGSMWFGELGYQWRWGNAMTTLSWTTVRSDLKETVSYSTSTAQLSITKSNPDTLIKWGIGAYF